MSARRNPRTVAARHSARGELALPAECLDFVGSPAGCRRGFNSRRLHFMKIPANRTICRGERDPEPSFRREGAANGFGAQKSRFASGAPSPYVPLAGESLVWASVRE